MQAWCAQASLFEVTMQTIQNAGDITRRKVHGNLVIAQQPFVHWHHFMLCATTAESLWRRCSTAPGHREPLAGAATGRRSSSCSVPVRAATASQPSSCRQLPACQYTAEPCRGACWQRPRKSACPCKAGSTDQVACPCKCLCFSTAYPGCFCRRCPQHFWSERGIH